MKNIWEMKEINPNQTKTQTPPNSPNKTNIHKQKPTKRETNLENQI